MQTSLGKDTKKDRPSDDRPIRVMIVDDSLTVRTVFSRMVDSDPTMEICATSSNAERAIAKLRELPVDVILLDLEMPGMGGLEALPKMLDTADHAQVLVVSSLTEDGAEHTMAALSMGAADTMLKPRPGGFDDAYRASLLGKIRALGGRDPDTPTAAAKDTSKSPIDLIARAATKRPEVIAFGASTGGIHALNIVLRALPRSFDLPILITQHLPSSFVPVFARQIEVASARRTHIGDEGTEICRGEVVIATGHGHMLVRRRGDRLYTGVSGSPAKSGCLPSVDPMLSSIAEATGGHALAAIMSGMGRDGVIGAESLVDAGGCVIAQDAESSAVWGMPGAVAKAGLASAIMPPDQMVEAILSSVGAAHAR